MTIQEAIKHICEIETDFAEQSEALDMAIKALEKQAKLEELMNIGAEIADRGDSDDE